MLRRVGETVDSKDAVVKIKMPHFQHHLFRHWSIIRR